MWCNVLDRPIRIKPNICHRYHPSCSSESFLTFHTFLINESSCCHCVSFTLQNLVIPQRELKKSFFTLTTFYQRALFSALRSQHSLLPSCDCSCLDQLNSLFKVIYCSGPLHERHYEQWTGFARNNIITPAPPLSEEVSTRTFLAKLTKEGTIPSTILAFQSKEGDDPKDSTLGQVGNRMFPSSSELLSLVLQGMESIGTN